MKLLVVKLAEEIKIGDQIVLEEGWIAGRAPQPTEVTSVRPADDGMVWIETGLVRMRIEVGSLVCVYIDEDDHYLSGRA